MAPCLLPGLLSRLTLPRMRWHPFRSLSFVWVITIVFFLIELGIGWTFAYRWYDRDTLKFAATVTGSTFALFVFLKKIEQDRILVAEKLIERWNKPDIKPILERCRPVVELTLKSKDYGRPTYVAGTAEIGATLIRGDIIFVLGFFEEIALAVTSGSGDETRLKNFFGAVIPRGYDAFEGLVHAERIADNEHDYYRPVQTLVERWTGRKRSEANAN